MTDAERAVRTALAAAGLDVPDADVAAIVAEYPGVRGMAQRVVALAEAVDEAPELVFRPDAPA